MTEFISKSVPLTEISPELLDQDQHQSSRLVGVQGFTQTTGHLVNYHALNGTDRQLVDDGDLLPSWVYWWLTLVAELCCSEWSESAALVFPNSGRFGIRNIFATLLNPSSSYQIIPLTVEDMCFAIGSAAWSSSVDIAVAWGMEGSRFNHPLIPLPCRGAIMPTADGLGAICIANEEDRRLLHAWIANENS